MKVPEPAQEFLLRIDEVADRYEALASAEPAPTALTEPDQPSGERWEWGQAWAHVAEFVPYWMRQIQKVLEADDDKPVPFGRVKDDLDRKAAIEADRSTAPRELMDRLSSQLRDLRIMLTDFKPEEWERQGVHPTLGEMNVERIVDRFLVSHLEEHADQLESLRGASA